MKIATFNINNVKKRLPNLLDWLKASKPDIACLQELKCTDEDFPGVALARVGYKAVWKGQKFWNGVAILSRRGAPVLTATTRLERRARELIRSGAPVILCGDLNVAPTPLDVYSTTSWDDDALVHPKSRAAYARLLKQGWTDALRESHPDERIYTFWHYMRRRWERDAGLRLDHLLISPAIAEQLAEAAVDRRVRALENASDHAPVWVQLAR